jgi:hypothetical protein
LMTLQALMSTLKTKRVWSLKVFRSLLMIIRTVLLQSSVTTLLLLRRSLSSQWTKSTLPLD